VQRVSKYWLDSWDRGAGKISVINALMSKFGLLPSSSERAAAAVVTQIAFNWRNDPAQIFRAEVGYISGEAWKAELDILYDDLRTVETEKVDGAESDDETAISEATERDARIEDSLGKLRAVYPHLTHDDLRKSSPKDLLADVHLSRLLGTTKHITNGDREQFLRCIKPYIDNTSMATSEGRKFAHWPLVKLVKIFVKAKILSTGLVLVDLPGSFDTNAARSSVAEKYQEQLAVTCVIAPIVRAANDSNAQKILTSAKERQLKLDGNFTTTRYCVVMSKIDDMPVQEYFRQYPDAKDSMSDETAESTRLQVEIRIVQQELREAKAVSQKNQNEMQHNEIVAKSLEENSRMPATRKRKRDGEGEDFEKFVA
jgi:hypothetical protein